MADAVDPKPATEHTRHRNEQAAATLAFDDDGDWGRARQGLIAAHPTGVIDGPFGSAWDVGEFDFMRASEQAPDSVHPSLWRQGRLNAVHGLFEVAEGIWQCRGYDISNITFIEGTDGWIVVDPLTTSFTARACLDLANGHLGERPVTAVIYTHSHVDHYGGILGVTTKDAVAAGDVRVIAPEGFMREAVSENLIAGPAMGRRAFYQFGMLLAPGPLGHIDCGLGKGIPRGQPDMVAPTEEIDATGIELDVDGVRIVFQNTPGTEAPAEMNFMFPDHRTLCVAENCTHTMHNALPFRGAQVRDTLAWSKYIQEAIDLFGSSTETMFSTHNWPRFGADDVAEYLGVQRDAYRFLHDQAMRLACEGQTPEEIAEEMALPDSLARHSHVRGYYGTLQHNSKAVYQRYLGWYDGNPAHLNPHPPEASGRRHVEAMGGAEAVLDAAGAALDDGDYRWVTELLNHLIFADPTNDAARQLQADAFEQLGYQAESGPWRDSYLMGAMELRTATKGINLGQRALSDELSVEMLVDLIGVRVVADRVADVEVAINWHFTDVDEHHVIGLGNSALRHRPLSADDAAHASVTTTKAVLADHLKGDLDLDAFVDALDIDGDADAVRTLFSALTRFTGEFGIVEP